ncbi:hypothetical protein [Salinarimonas sp.]|uniref:hypothetical protein n=1 Tax=Salinarimonas sp. TaxID=2766526 RepID=UPI0032D99475
MKRTHSLSDTLAAAALAGGLVALLAAPALSQGAAGSPPDRPPPREEGFVEYGGYADALGILGDDYRLPPPANESRGPLTIVDFDDGEAIRAPSGDVVGEIDKVVLGPDHERWVVFDHGGVLGFGERKLALPLARFVRRDDDLYVQGVTEEDVRNLPGVVQRWEDYPRIEVQGPLGIDESLGTD